MFEAITENLSKALRNLRGLGKLTEENMAEALGEVRKALLSADVHFKVARDFTDRVKAECVGLEVVKSVTPGQQIVKIISDELEKLLDTILPKKPLRAYGVKPEDLPRFTEAVMTTQQRLMNNNFVPLDEARVLKIYGELY